jgi:signal transduction histidine kinase/CheY-like chemotaxis protein/PAS domain-containing protein
MGEETLNFELAGIEGIERMSLPVFVAQDGRVVYQNTSAKTWLGRALPENAPLGVLPLIGPRDSETLRACLESGFLDGQPSPQIRLRGVPGGATPALLFPAAGVFGDRPAVAIVVRAGQKDSLVFPPDFQQMLGVLDSLEEIVYVSDPQTYEILYANPAFQHLLGKTGGKSCHKAFQGLDSPCPLCSNERLFSQTPPASQAVVECKNLPTGKWLRCLDKTVSWPDERRVRLTIATDNSWRILFQEALERRFSYEDGLVGCSRELLTLAPDAVTRALARLVSAYGVARASVLQNHPDKKLGLCARLTHEACAQGTLPRLQNPLFGRLPYAKHLSRWQDLLSRRETVSGPAALFPENEKNLLLSLGAGSVLALPLWIQGEWTGFLLFEDPSESREWRTGDVRLLGMASEMIGSFLGHRRFEEDKEHLETQLHQAQKMEAIGTLAGGIAHDFNNVLGSIMACAELIVMEPDNKALVTDNIGKLLGATHRAKELVTQILSFTRKSRKEKRPVQLQILVREVARLLRSTLPGAIEIKRNIPKNLDPVLADPAQIHQVLMNLSANAGHAMREHGGTLTIALDSVVHPDGEKDSDPGMAPGKYARLTVSDTGCGMDASVLERIFDPYYTTKDQGEGTGLGLAVVRGIVRGHGGGITVMSEPGKGSVFRLYFPMTEEAGQEEQEPRPAIHQIRGIERVLLVDDERDLVDSLRRVLENFGYRVTALTSGLEALRLFHAAPDAFDIVITDQTMPHVTGKTLAAEVLRVRPSLPVILCTGYSAVFSPEDALKTGITKYMYKPISFADFARTVREALDQAKGKDLSNPVSAPAPGAALKAVKE